MPPKGKRGSDLTAPLTKTEPASISAARSAPRAGSEVQRLAPRPERERLAGAVASAGAAGGGGGGSPGGRPWRGRRRRPDRRSPRRRPPSPARRPPARSARRTSRGRPAARRPAGAARPAGQRAADLVVQDVEEVRAGQRSDRGPAVEGIAHRKRLHAPDERVLEALGGLLHDDEALSGDAALSRVRGAGLRRLVG